MKATSLLTGWTCRHLGDTAPGKTVTLPHDAMLAEPRTALSAGGTNTGWYEGYDYEYRRTLTVPETELADTHILEFEGVYHNAEVWLNGQKAAFRPYGYTNFYVDCAPYLHAGENELRVIARNADQPIWPGRSTAPAWWWPALNAALNTPPAEEMSRRSPSTPSRALWR